MKFLFFSSSTYLPQTIGGSKLATHELSLELIKAGHRIAVLATLQSGDLIFLMNRFRAKIIGRNKVIKDQVMGYPVYRSWVADADVQRTLDVVLDEFEPDAVIFEAGFGQRLDLAKYCQSIGVASAIYFHDVEFEKMRGLAEVTNDTLLIANSRYTADSINKYVGNNVVVVQPVVNAERYRVRNDPTYVLHINPHPLKGIDITLDVAAARPDIPFLVQESWSLSDELLAPYKLRAALLPNVEWRPPTKNMKAVLAKTKIILVPSRWIETWGRVVTEAQLNGIPVISSNTGGLPESVGSGGIILDVEATSEEWVTQLSKLWDDISLYRSQVNKALKHAERLEIQPKNLMSIFVRTITAHIIQFSANTERSSIRRE